jgi:hypothetical protein
VSEPADWKRAQRERARKAGLCIVCCERKARAKKSTCAQCSAEAYERVKARRARIAAAT